MKKMKNILRVDLIDDEVAPVELLEVVLLAAHDLERRDHHVCQHTGVCARQQARSVRTAHVRSQRVSTHVRKGQRSEIVAHDLERRDHHICARAHVSRPVCVSKSPGRSVRTAHVLSQQVSTHMPVQSVQGI